MYYSLYRNMLGLACIVYTNDTAAIEDYKHKCDTIMRTVYNADSEQQYAFFMVLFAEYKETICIFWQTMMTLYDNRLYNTIKQFDKILYTNDAIFDMLYHHVHDDKNFIFADQYTKYRFQMHEKSGEYIIDLWEKIRKK